MRANYLVILFFFLLFSSCKQFEKVSDAIINPSARKVFERDLKENDSLFGRYQFNYNQSKNNNLKLNLPVVVYSKADSLGLSPLAYTISLKKGQRLKIETEKDSVLLLIDLYSFRQDSVMPEKAIASNKRERNQLTFDVKRSGNYKIVIVPSAKSSFNFGVKIFTESMFEFPVEGKDNSAVQSFWGAIRGNGKRKHEGIDIFAKRGTPVVAISDGSITTVRNAGLGGKQVWMRTGMQDYTVYYAHLDSVVVRERNKVNVGDILGFVGNTGNAKNASPHLHFGMYGSSGAVDPFPFVKKEIDLFIKNEQVSNKGITNLKINELRVGPNSKNDKIRDLDKNTKVKILSKIDKWYHIQVNDNLEGFMHESLISEAKL